MGNLLSDNREVGRMAARHLMDRGHKSFLVVWYEGRSPHDERAEGFLEIVRAKGHTVVSFPHSFQGDKDLAFYQMGYDAMDWLLDHPGPTGKDEVGGVYRSYPPVEVVARASTAAGACSDPITARMIRWIWERVREGRLITVSDLSRAHHLTRKTLERSRALRREHGCSPREYRKREGRQPQGQNHFSDPTRQTFRDSN